MVPSSLTPFVPCRRTACRLGGLGLLLAISLLSGCVGQRHYFQTLEPGAESLDGSPDGLLLMPLHVWPLESNLKVSSLLLAEYATGNSLRIVFYENSSLGSQALRHHKQRLEVAQYPALRLPAGRYRLVSVDLAFLWQQTEAGVASVAATRDYSLVVDDTPLSYAGRLSVEIERLTVSDQFGERSYRFPLDEPIRLYSLDSRIGVEGRLRVDDRMDADLRAIRAEYPALEAFEFEKNLLR